MEKTRRTVLQSQTSSTAAGHKKIRPEVPFDLYSFPFENVVFEGGSGNLLAYIGAVRVSHIPSTKYTETMLFNLIRRRMPPRCAIPTLNSSVGSYRIPMGSLPWTLKSISFPYRPYVLVWWAIATSIAYVRDEGILWLIGVAVYLSCCTAVHLSAIAGSGWSHNAPRYHYSSWQVPRL